MLDYAPLFVLNRVAKEMRKRLSTLSPYERVKLSGLEQNINCLTARVRSDCQTRLAEDTGVLTNPGEMVRRLAQYAQRANETGARSAALASNARLILKKANDSSRQQRTVASGSPPDPCDDNPVGMLAFVAMCDD